MTQLRTADFDYDESDVTSITGQKCTVPNGKHFTSDLNSGTGAMSTRPIGLAINISAREWKRSQDLGRVRE